MRIGLFTLLHRCLLPGVDSGAGFRTSLKCIRRGVCMNICQIYAVAHEQIYAWWRVFVSPNEQRAGALHRC
jgi:hypothetical protein